MVVDDQSVSRDVGTECLPPGVSPVRRLCDQRALSKNWSNEGWPRAGSRCGDRSQEASMSTEHRHGLVKAACVVFVSLGLVAARQATPPKPSAPPPATAPAPSAAPAILIETEKGSFQIEFFRADA